MNQQLITAQQADDLGLAFVVTAPEAKRRIEELQGFIRDVMIENEDFGTIPGTPKPTLYQPGAQKLCEIYGLAPTFIVMQRIEIWEGNGLFSYEVLCRLVSKRTGLVVAEGLGSCNSKEGRYRWRNGQRHCPHCMQEAIIKGKVEYGGGWVCFRAKGGCNAKFNEDDPLIVSQSVGRVENDDIFSMVNTFLKMAMKRSHVAATLCATRSSGIFTQDMEDLPDGDGFQDDGAPRQQRPAQQRTGNGGRQQQQRPAQREQQGDSQGQIVAIGNQAAKLGLADNAVLGFAAELLGQDVRDLGELSRADLGKVYNELSRRVKATAQPAAAP